MMISRALSELERLLPPEFLRVHRSHIANLNQVRGLDGKMLKFADGSELPVGRAYAKRLTGYLAGISTV
jgi:two-component system, LytTR family, response regulator LytT